MSQKGRNAARMQMSIYSSRVSEKILDLHLLLSVTGHSLYVMLTIQIEDLFMILQAEDIS